MADTDFGALNATRKIVFDRMIWQDGRDNSFWHANGFMGRGTGDMSKPIHYVNSLTATDKGDKCVMQLVQDLVSDGVVGENELYGNEESLVNDEIEIVIDQIRNGVRSKGRMSRQVSVINFRKMSRTKLGYWIADKLDELGFLTACGIPYTKRLDGTERSVGSQLQQLAFAAAVAAPTSRRVMYAGTATSTGSLTAADTINWNTIVQGCAFAKRAHMKPVRVNGKSTYIAVLSTEELRDLKQDPTYQSNVRNAAPRGDKNPLFSKAIAMIDDIVIHETNRVPTTLGLAEGSKWGSGGSVDGASGLLLGAQALGYAEIKGEASGYDELDNTDYGAKQGNAISRMIGYLKPSFDSIWDGGTEQDFGCIVLRAAASTSG